MFWGYQIELWEELFKYCVLVMVLFTGIGILSCICSNKMIHHIDNTIKGNYNKNKEKKSYFIDVA